LVPDHAIGTDQGRKFVLTVNADNTAQTKYVALGRVIEGNMRVVKEGLSAGDQVIVNGLMRARAGQKVTPQQEGAPAQISGGSQTKTQ
jgi:multidrug efflux pump subunit AcrA (membrane-fusion protein)